ncbi:MAG: MoxR family ATPase [Eubacterium sp.]|nr:MoxR family ATPase [Eubacterium sp.]
MLNNKITDVLDEVEKVIKGKRDIIERVMMAICASGHILLEDNPGSGKTTMAKAFSKAIGLDFKRLQFTPDTMPSDITGYYYMDKEKRKLQYMPGAVQCNMLLGDEINRTSAKTQSALLEPMEEGTVTLEGSTQALPKPFILIATQNPVTSLGTQPLPDSQCDRFMVKLSMGYPSLSDEASILMNTSVDDITNSLSSRMTIKELMEIRDFIDKKMKCNADVIDYICRLCDETRHNSLLEVGVSTRGSVALKRMASARAYFDGRDYVTPDDVYDVFIDVTSHRVILSPDARMEDENEISILTDILDNKVQAPQLKQS